jgi:alpha-L-rhamnosidase
MFSSYKSLLASICILALCKVDIAQCTPQAAVRLRTEYRLNPSVVLSSVMPRFSWEPISSTRGETQTAYQVIVTSVTTGSTAWDSGKVLSSATNQVAFGGATLAADTIYSWTVTWWDGSDVSAPISETAYFGTEPGNDNDWNAIGSQWIGCTNVGGMPNANLLRVEFDAQPKTPGLTVTQARLYVSGIGLHIPFMNGQRLGESVLDPTFTNLRMRVLYTAHDVTSLLDTSARGNAFAAMLGNGWPNVFAPWGGSGTGEAPWNGTGSSISISHSTRREDLGKLSQEEIDLMIKQGLGHGHTGYERRLRAWLSIRWSDGSITSVVSSANAMGRSISNAAPSGWQCGTGPLLADDVYAGCTYDARAETPGWTDAGFNYSSGQWADAVRIAEPGGKMAPAQGDPVEIVNSIEPIAMWQSRPDAYVFDMGQNFAGVVRLSIAGPTVPGVTIVMRHAEAIMHPPYGAKDGTLYYGNLRSAEATDTYTTKGSSDDGETFIPLFTWHGFRYVEVFGLPYVPTLTGSVTGLVYRSSLSSTGSLAFPDSANTMNQLQHGVFWGQASNLLGNPSDCPQRDERLGWTGDSALTNEESALNFDMAAFYTQWAATIDDSLNNQVDSTWKSGGLPETIPDITGGYNADASWSSVFPTTVHTVWKAYNDARIVQTYWSDLMLYVNQTVAGMGGGNIDKIFSTWGDWCPPGEKEGDDQGPKPSPAFSAGGTFLGDLANLIEMSTALNTPDTARLQALWQTLASQFNNAWGNNGAYYGSSPTDGAQTAQAHALGVGVVPDANRATIAAYLVADIAKHNGHLSVGIIGMKHLMRALTATGNADIAINISLQTDYPSFGFAFNHEYEPATTLWELWNGPTEGPGMNSRNHIMQGSIGAWLYTDVGGISQQPGTSGYQSLLLWPRTTTHPSLPSASSSFASIAGEVAVEWLNNASSFMLTATVPVNTVAEVRIPFPAGTLSTALIATEGSDALSCVASAPENTPVTFSCPGGTFTSVTFASYGTPTGSCGSGFSNGSCNAASSVALVSAACVGRSSCSIDVSDTTFTDPCFGVVKSFSASLACSSNSTSNVFFKNGQYVPNAITGIKSASINVNASALSVFVGSGVYAFELSGW